MCFLFHLSVLWDVSDVHHLQGSHGDILPQHASVCSSNQRGIQTHLPHVLVIHRTEHQHASTSRNCNTPLQPEI